MRQGQNPAKMGLPAYLPKRLGLALLSYIPSQDGYFAHSLEVLRYQIASIHKNTPVEFNLHVLDNGSCQEVKNVLQKMQADGWIDWLTLSKHNLGKAGALNWALRAMPNEVLCYSDGDVYFRPGWYESSIKVLKTFPQTGMVTAQPCFFDNLNGKGRAQFALRGHEEFQFSVRLADITSAEEYVRSIGNTPDLLDKYRQHSWEVVQEKTSGVEAVVGSSPFQFMGYKTTLEKILPLSYTHAMREDVQITARLDDLGYLQLSTLRPFIYHMGNQVDETTLDDARRDYLDTFWKGTPASRTTSGPGMISQTKRRAFRLLDSLTHHTFLKKLLQGMYTILFEYYAKPK